MNGLVRSMLETDLLGRPVRKILWVAYRLGVKFHNITTVAWDRHPYVQKLKKQNIIRGLKPYERPKLTNPDDVLERYYRGLESTLSQLEFHPQISVLVPVYKVAPDFLKECLASVATQIYSNWQVCIVDDCSNDPEIDRVLIAFEKKYSGKVKVARNLENLHISRTTNRALELADGEYVALLDHDDRLNPNALAEVVRFINLKRDSDVFFSDECVIDEKGETLGTYLKPGWSPLMHLSVNYTTHFSVYKTSLLRSIGGCRSGFEGAQDHDVMLRATEATKHQVIHIPLNLYQWRSHVASTASGDSSAKPYARDAGIRAVAEACERRGTPASVTFEAHHHHYKVRFKPSFKTPPLVSILVPTRDGIDLLRPCLESVFEKSEYKNVEVIVVDHQSKDPACLQFLRQMEIKYTERFRTIRYEGLFNFAVMNNLAAKEAKGEYLILLNNDTEVIAPQWIDEMLAVAQLPTVGAVGAKLLYPGGVIQHAGVVGLGPHVAGNVACGESNESNGYFGYHQTIHEVLAVTGACLMVSKAKYWAAGGLETCHVPNGFGDVDFCLKLRKQGYSNVYVPYAVLTHKESWTRDVTFELFERYFMLQNWGQELLTDPYRHVAMEMGLRFKTEKRYRQQVLGRATYEKWIRGGMVS